MPSLVRTGLAVAAQGYGWFMASRNRRYDRGHGVVYAPVPVISVGNLTVGGTGKTPCVEMVARICRDEFDLVTVILSRGYGSERGPNDEALVLEANLPDVPHLQGADRVALARTAIEELEAEVLILDDGFQHRRLGRDLDLVLIDATDPWGGGSLLPRGLLREPAWGLRRAAQVLLTRCDLVPAERIEALERQVRRLAPGISVGRTVHAPLGLIAADESTGPTTDLVGKPILGVCGIGNPDGFYATLRHLGADVRDLATFPDHHAYSRQDVDTLIERAGLLPREGWVVTTQKDLVKLRTMELAGRPTWAVRIGLQCQTGQDLLREHLRAAIAHGQAPRTRRGR
jgi:tetraacyldisaccharide 4'-kinase